MSDFNMFHGERVKYAGYHPFSVARKASLSAVTTTTFVCSGKVKKTIPPVFTRRGKLFGS